MPETKIKIPQALVIPRCVILLAAHGLNGVVGAGATSFAPPFYYGLQASRFNFTVDRPGILKMLSMWTNSAQPATGTLTATVAKNNAASSLVVTIPAGGGSQYVQDLVHTVSVAAGDAVSIDIKNNASSNSAQVNSLSIAFETNIIP